VFLLKPIIFLCLFALFIVPINGTIWFFPIAALGSCRSGVFGAKHLWRLRLSPFSINLTVRKCSTQGGLNIRACGPGLSEISGGSDWVWVSFFGRILQGVLGVVCGLVF
jgi:hypothetical protein